MSSLKLPKEGYLDLCHYRGYDEDGKPANITYSFARINGCLIDTWEGVVNCIYFDVNDSDCEFIIGIVTGRLTDRCALKYGFSSVEDAYDQYEGACNDLNSYKFMKSCGACGDVIEEPNADQLIHYITEEVWVHGIKIGIIK